MIEKLLNEITKDIDDRNELISSIPSMGYLIISNLEKEEILKETREVVTSLAKKEIPVYSDNLLISHSWFCFSLRERIIELQGFCLVQDSWVNPLSKFLEGSKVVELMSGRGTLTKALKDKGVDITATDNFSSYRFTKDKFWTTVLNVEATKAIEEYPADNYILAWPPMDESAYNVLITMREKRPEAKMIYIGEMQDGCTASSKFFDICKPIIDSNFNEVTAMYRNFNIVNDRVILLK